VLVHRICMQEIQPVPVQRPVSDCNNRPQASSTYFYEVNIWGTQAPSTHVAKVAKVLPTG